MKVIDTVTFHYVVPETPEEKAEIDRLIADVGREKPFRDFALDDLQLVRPSEKRTGHWVQNNDKPGA